MRWGKWSFILFIVIFNLTLGYFLFIPAYNQLSCFLSKTERVNANILIVEGWLPIDAVENALYEFQKNRYEYIITTGLKSNSDYYMLSRNGYLIFNPKEKYSLSTDYGSHNIEISAFSELGGSNCAHFNVFINDSLISNFYADKKKRRYLSTWKGKINEIGSILVQFDNDEVGEFGDRNLYVKEVSIDHRIRIPYLNNSEYDISEPGGKRRIINNFSSNAELIKNNLISLGIDSSRVVAIPGKRALINRTLTSALAVLDWLKNSDMKVKGINIVSIGTHARRTWMTYKKVLNKSYKIGIISLPDYKNSHSRKNQLIKTLRETVAFMYYWVILIPY